MKFNILAYATAAICALLVGTGVHAQSAADTTAIDRFALPMGTPQGRRVLGQNLAAVIATNNDATKAERNQAVRGRFSICDLAYSTEANQAEVDGDSRPLQVAPGEIESFTGTDYLGDTVDVTQSVHPTVATSPADPKRNIRS